MKSNIYTYVRFLAITLTILAVIGNYYLPKQRLVIHPTTNASASIYGFFDPNSGPSESWVNKTGYEWRCNFEPTFDSGCGFSLSWGEDSAKGIDLSKYDGFNIALSYEGAASNLRLFLRNFNPAYATKGDGESTKFMSVIVSTDDFKANEAFVSFSAFTVAEWWVRQRNTPWQLAAPELNNIVVIGLDHIEHGVHNVRVEKLELVGDWVKTEDLLLGIAIFLMAILLSEGFVRFYFLYKKSQQGEELIDEMVSSYQKLEAQKDEFKIRSLTDVLTGILNRAGMAQYARKLFDEQDETVGFGVMVFDIDYFKPINDQYGHDVGDQVLIELTKIVSDNIREEDIFARWGGEEFVLLCPKKSKGSFMSLAEKLREVIASHEFNSKLSLNVTVSIGVTSVHKNDTFEYAFKRADKALYQAKSSGRNCVRYEV